MAIAKLLPRKATPTKTRAQSMAARHDYDSNPDKTRGGELVSSYMCQPESAAAEFEASKLIYEASTGRSQPKDRDVVMYRIVQSFKPGETTPEEANRIGYELAMEFTKGQHQFVIYTHEDKAHIHNHIEFNSTNLECDGKFQNVKDSVKVLRRMNDKICQAHGLSVPTPKRKKSLSQEEMGAAKYGKSFKKKLQCSIDAVLPGCKDFEEFLERMREEGYEVRHRGKLLEFRAPDQLRFTRSFRLGAEYTEEALRERTGGRHKGETARKTAEKASAGKTTAEKTAAQAAGKTAAGKKQSAAKGNVNLLVDIQAKMQAGKGKGYERWAKVFNLKEAAKTINFLTENDVADYEELAARAEAAGKKFDSLSTRIKQLEGRMAEVAQLRMHIINYSKTRQVYSEYRKSRQKNKFLAEHGDEIKMHEAAKAAFDALGGKPIPKVAQLSAEYAALLAEKKEKYEEYKAARKEMIDFQTAKNNVDRILGMEPPGQEQKKQYET